MTELLKEQLPIETVLCVVPQATEKLPDAAAGLNIIELSALVDCLHQ
jgi:hypothetical protein